MMEQKILKPREAREQWIFEELTKNPALGFVECFGNYGAMFGKSEPTFRNEWKQAKQRHSKHITAINEQKLDVITQTELKATEMGILDKLGNMKILSEIITNKEEQTADRIRAVDVLNRMQGNYSADNEQSASKTIIWNEIKKYNDGTEL